MGILRHIVTSSAIICGANLYGQQLPQQVILMIEDVFGETPSEEILIGFEELARIKPDINSLGREALEAAHLFSIFQIESLLDHRAHYGDILSMGELAVVDGFNSRKARLCSFFFRFSSEAPPADTSTTDIRHQALAKAKKKYGENGFSITAKYNGEAANGKLAFGCTLDSDAGESLSRVYHPDFTSAFIQYKGEKATIIAGDYSVRFGQGLVVWKGFGLSSVGKPSSMIRKGRGITPYRSTDESNFFRGAAAMCKVKNTDFTAFLSANALDARIEGDTAYTSIITGGYHRTDAEISKRRTMMEYAGGVAASREFGRWKVGLTAIAYGYDKLNGRAIKDYNRYQLYDGIWGNVGADIFCHWLKFRLTAEAAVDFGGSGAAIASLVWAPAWAFEMGLSGRLYSKSYISTHSGAYSTLSSCSNQRGITLSVRWLPSDLWQTDFQADYAYYPWQRYNIPSDSEAFKVRLTTTRTIGERSYADIQLRFNANHDAGGWERLPQARLNASISISNALTLEGRIAGNDGGAAAFIGCKAVLLSGQLSVSSRISWYDISDYNHRIYFYEGDVPQSFSIKSYYGKGFGACGLIRYAPRLKNRRMKPELWLKVSQEVSSLFVRLQW